MSVIYCHESHEKATSNTNAMRISSVEMRSNEISRNTPNFDDIDIHDIDETGNGQIRSNLTEIDIVQNLHRFR